MPSSEQSMFNSRNHTQAFHSGMVTESSLCKGKSHQFWKAELMGIYRAKRRNKLLFYTGYGHVLQTRVKEAKHKTVQSVCLQLCKLKAQPIFRVLGSGYRITSAL